MERININYEFDCLKSLIEALWDGTDTDACKNIMAAAFQAGLNDGKLWIDKHFAFEIAKVLNGNDEIELPLERRARCIETDSFARLYDALQIFDSALTRGISRIHRSVTGYGRWSFERNAGCLCVRLIQQFGSVSVSPKDLSKEVENQIVKNYTGLLGISPGSCSTPNKFRKDFVEYSRDEQGMSLRTSFISNIYSHGLYVAQVYNTHNLVLDVLPVYALRDAPLNFDNGPDILAATQANPLVRLALLVEPAEFQSSEKYTQAVEASRENSGSKQRSKEEISVWVKQMLKDIEAKKEALEIKNNAIVDAFAATHTAPELNAAA